MQASAGPEDFERRLAAIETKVVDDIERRLVDLEVDKAVATFVLSTDGEVRQRTNPLTNVAAAMRGQGEKSLQVMDGTMLDQIEARISATCKGMIDTMLELKIENKMTALEAEIQRSKGHYKENGGINEAIGHMESNQVQWQPDVVGKHSRASEELEIGTANSMEANHTRTSFGPARSSDKLECTMSREILEYDTEEGITYVMKDSVWDAGAFVWQPCIGVGGSTLVSIAMVMNICFQILFSQIVVTSFVKRSFGDNQEYSDWRWTDGHSFTKMDPFTKKSLVTRVCSGDHSLSEATVQTQDLELIQKYMTPVLHMPSGVVLAMMCVFLFTSSIIQEVDNTLAFCRAFWQSCGKSTVILASTDGFEVRSISRARMTGIIGITSIRLIVAGMILYGGCKWLAITPSIEDLVLNATALEFVLSIDELFYAAFCPLLVRTLLESMQPMPYKATRSLAGVGPELLSYLMAMFTTVMLFTYLVILPFVDDMETIERNLCDGEKEFVIGVQVATSQLFAGTSSPDDASDDDESNAVKAVQQVIATGSLDDNEYATYSRGLSLQGTINAPLGEYVVKSRHRCRDRNLSNDLPLKNALQIRTRIQGSNCSEFKGKCATPRSGSLVRLLCPVTCKCGMPRSGLYLDGEDFGCSRKNCRDEIGKDDFKNLDCRDESVANLQNDSSWNAYWDQYLGYWGTRTQFYTLMRSKALTLGCDFDDIVYVCDETGAVGSVRTYCPVACGCLSYMYPDCPTKCRNFSSPVLARHAQVAIAQGLINLSSS